jgi:hypothetical protein
MKPYDERPWWCQFLPSVFEPSWYAEVEDFDAWLAEVMRRLARPDDEPTAAGEQSASVDGVDLPLTEMDAEQQKRTGDDAAG